MALHRPFNSHPIVLKYYQLYRYSIMLYINFGKIQHFLYIGKQAALETARGLFGFLYVKLYFSAIIVLNAITWVIAYQINTKAIGNKIIILHYNVDFGVNLINSAGQTYLIPSTGLIIFLFNFIILLFFYKKNRLISHLLLAAPVLANMVFLIALQLIYYINFR